MIASLDARIVVNSDAELISRYCEAGDQQAFTELVHRYRDPVFRLAVSILGQGFAPEAEEVAQEVFLRVHHALSSFRGEAQLGSWIYRITFNLAVNWKSRMRYRAPHLGDEALNATPSTEAGPLEQLEEARRGRALQECVSELPEVYQAALRLHYWMGEPLAAVAELIGVPENTVKSYLHRSRRLLHEMLKERGFGDV